MRRECPAKRPHRSASSLRGWPKPREIAKSQSISYGTAANYLRRVQTAQLDWPLPEGMSERELTAALFPERTTVSAHHRFVEPDYPRIHLELKSVGMTKQLAWEEYPFHAQRAHATVTSSSG